MRFCLGGRPRWGFLQNKKGLRSVWGAIFLCVGQFFVCLILYARLRIGRERTKKLENRQNILRLGLEKWGEL